MNVHDGIHDFVRQVTIAGVEIPKKGMSRAYFFEPLGIRVNRQLSGGGTAYIASGPKWKLSFWAYQMINKNRVEYRVLDLHISKGTVSDVQSDMTMMKIMI